MKFSDVTAEDRYLRIGLFGKQSVGKTHMALTGPGKVLVFDVEGRIASMAGVDGIPTFSKVEYDERNIVHDLIDATNEVRKGTTSFRSFVVDSWTDLELTISRQRGFSTELANTGDKSRAFALADHRSYLERQVLTPLLTGATKCHLIYTAHEKNEWGATGGGGAQTVGKLPDATRNFSHYFDLCFNMLFDAKTKERSAVVTKSNYQSHFAIGQVIKNLSWEHLAPIIGRKVAVDEIKNEMIRDLFVQTGRPASDLGAWFTENGFSQRDNKWILTAEEKHRVVGLLRTEIDEKTGAAA